MPGELVSITPGSPGAARFAWIGRARALVLEPRLARVGTLTPESQ